MTNPGVVMILRWHFQRLPSDPAHRQALERTLARTRETSHIVTYEAQYKHATVARC